jgi:hypothetical protein
VSRSPGHFPECRTCFAPPRGGTRCDQDVCAVTSHPRETRRGIWEDNLNLNDKHGAAKQRPNTFDFNVVLAIFDLTSTSCLFTDNPTQEIQIGLRADPFERTCAIKWITGLNNRSGR